MNPSNWCEISRRLWVGLIGLVAVLVPFAFPAQAILRTVDDPVFGPSSLVRDTETQLEWLRFDQPQNFVGTWSEWNAAISGDPLYAAFHLRTSAEIRDLWDKGNIPADTPNGSSISPASFDAAIPFVDLIGGYHNPASCDSNSPSCDIQQLGWRNAAQSQAGFNIGFFQGGPPLNGVINSAEGPFPPNFVRRAWIARTIFTIGWVTVGDPGNACDTQSQGCFGAVAYPYRISKYEITNAQYAEFLNAVAASDTWALYSTGMGSGYGGITRSGSSGSYTYSAITGRENMPVNYVSFWSATRFANWLHNGQPAGAQDATTTEDGAYTLLRPRALRITPSRATPERRSSFQAETSGTRRPITTRARRATSPIPRARTYRSPAHSPEGRPTLRIATTS